MGGSLLICIVTLYTGTICNGKTLVASELYKCYPGLSGKESYASWQVICGKGNV